MTPSLPDLAPRLRALLAAYRVALHDLPRLAADLARDPLDLAAELAHPDLRPWLAHLDDLDRRARDTLHAAHRAIAHEALADLCRAADNPIERRRAATALLRSLNHAALPSSSSSSALSGAGPFQAPSSTPTSSHTSTSSLAEAGPFQAPSSLPSPTLPPPSATPHPDLTPPQVADTLLRALRRPDHPARHTGLATLAAFATPGARLDAVPLPDDDDTLIAAATARHTPFRVLRILDGARQHWPAEPPVVSDSRATLRFGVATPRGARVVTLTLTRDPRDPHDPHDSQRLDDPDTSDDDLDAATDALDDEPDDIPDDSLDDDLHPAPWRLAALDSS